jgi:hypothetical protein
MPLLNVKQVRFDNRVYDDSGSGAYKDLTTWKPICLFYLFTTLKHF